MDAKIKPKDLGRVAVLLGGCSNEREVSLEGGLSVIKALKSAGVDAYPVDPKFGLIEQLQKGKFSRVFNALHGGQGENGVVQGVLEMMGLPYFGSSVAASSLAMDKARSKLIFKSLGISTLDFFVPKNINEARQAALTLGLPLAMKPNADGSSVGVHKIKTFEEFNSCYVDTFSKSVRADGSVLLEPWIEGEEYTVGILANKALPAIRLGPTSEFYDYNAKYLSKDTKYEFNTLEKKLEEEIKQLALRAFNALSCKDWGRVDIIRDAKTKELFVLEVNTIPGLTAQSCVPKAAKEIGLNFTDFLLTLLSLTVKEDVSLAS